MSRWHLTSDEASHRRAANVCQEADLDVFAAISTDRYDVQTYRKRAVSVDNFVEIDDGDWVCSAGTILVDGDMGSPALHTLYTRFRDGDVAMARSEAIGHYAIAIKQGSKISIFTDPQGALTLYYAEPDDQFVLSNSLHTIAATLQTRTIDSINLVATALQSAQPSDETLFRGVHRLSGVEVIRIDLEAKTLHTEELPQSTQSVGGRQSSITTAVNDYAERVREVFQQIAAQGLVGIMTTGGLDTRTVLAATLEREARPLLAYGVGNSILTYPESADFTLAELLAEECDLPVYRMDWSGDHPYSSQTLEQLFSRYGFKYEIYGAAKSFLTELEGGITPYPDLLVGGYSPAFTNMKPWEWRDDTYTLDDLNEWYIHDFVNHSTFGCKDTYRSFIASAIEERLLKSPIAEVKSEIDLETFVKAVLHLNLRSQDRMINLVNEFCPYLAPFHLKPLYDPLVEMPISYRSEDEFQLKLIDELQPDLLKIPVVSGGSLITINRNTLTRNARSEYPPMAYLANSRATRAKFTLLGFMRAKLRPVIESYMPRSIEVAARRCYGWLRTDPVVETDVNEQIRAAAAFDVERSILTDDCLPAPIHLRIHDLNRLRHYLCGIETLGFDEVRAHSQ